MSPKLGLKGNLFEFIRIFTNIWVNSCQIWQNFCKVGIFSVSISTARCATSFFDKWRGWVLFGFFQIYKYSIIIELSLNPVDFSDILLQLIKTVKIMDV